MLSLALLGACASQKTTPLELAIWPGQDRSGEHRGLQLWGPDYSVVGMRLGLAADNVAVDGLDLVGVGEVGEANGIAAGLAYRAEQHHGICLGLAVDAGMLRGLQVAAVPHYRSGIEGRTHSVQGVQLGLLNATDRLQGLQVAPVWNNAGSVQGAQVGLVNVARDEVEGVQFGLINSCRGGVQIGLLCWNPKGFLPVFPLFNF